MQDLLKLFFRVGKRLVLPGFGAKGNVLTSILALFSESTGALIRFRRDLLDMPFPTLQIPARARLDAWWAIGKRWLRKGLVAAAWALFVLSSFEWTSVPPSPPPRVETLATVQEIPGADIPDTRECRIGDPDRHCILPYAVSLRMPASIVHRPIRRRWLQLGYMRI
ncbi:MAG TPA: hypothetical protein VN616_08355 [Puia sp.]|nr:hypothetical protein [Puia sp.]